MQLVQDFSRARDHIAGNNGAIARAYFGDEMPAVSRSNNRAAERHDSFGALAIENDVIAWWQQTFEAVTESDYFPAKFFAGQNNAAKDGVQSWAITAAGENADPCLHNED